MSGHVTWFVLFHRCCLITGTHSLYHTICVCVCVSQFYFAVAVLFSFLQLIFCLSPLSFVYSICELWISIWANFFFCEWLCNVIVWISYQMHVCHRVVFVCAEWNEIVLIFRCCSIFFFLFTNWRTFCPN